MERETAAGQVLFGGIYGTSPTDETLRRIGDGRLGGVIVMGRNVESASQVHALLATCAEATPPGLPAPLFGVDQEGGRVRRLRGAPFLDLPSARELAARGDPEATRRAMHALARQLRALGFTVDFAPVLDVDGGAARQIIGDRSFSGDPEVAGLHGAAAIQGLLEGGICPCGKHFPGHGATTHDSHVGLPRVASTLEELEARDLLPFRQAFAQGLPMLMPAHVVYESLDGERPATMSPAVLRGLLRERLGYEGVVVTDDLVMGAVAEAGGAIDVAVEALMVGADLLLVCHQEELQEDLRSRLAQEARRSPAVGRRLDEAVARVLALRGRFTPAPVPPAEVTAALEAAASDLPRSVKGHRAT